MVTMLGGATVVVWFILITPPDQTYKALHLSEFIQLDLCETDFGLYPKVNAGFMETTDMSHIYRLTRHCKRELFRHLFTREDMTLRKHEDCLPGAK